MKLINIINKIDCKVIGSKRRNVEGLFHVADKVTKNGLFFCLNGKVNNGIDFAADAIKNGAKVIVTSTSINASKVTQLIVSDVRKAMSQIAAIFYGEPANKLKIIGVTGTNGKTTTTTMIAHALKSKYNVGLIGTNGATYNNQTYSTGFTTPDPIILQQIFADMVNSGVTHVVMEMSAHAIYLQKLWGVMSDIIAFTNLSQDHLDYFENMDNYFKSKAIIFEQNNYNHAVVCTDTDYGRQLAKLCKNLTTCSSCAENIKLNTTDIFIKDVEHTTTSQTFTVVTKTGSGKIQLNMLGSFNLQNAIVAISVLLKCGLSLDEIAESLLTLHGVDGRFECYSNNESTIIVDYAHTPDGLKNLLVTAKEIAGKNKVISVFGCGGNRDTEKRPIMGAISEEFADITIITTDNPRFEDNYKIATEVSTGFTKKKYEIILDRGQAIRRAIELSRKGDIIVLAGKGSEDYLDVRGTKVEYSDKQLVKSLLCID